MSWTGKVNPRVSATFAGSGITGLTDSVTVAIPTAETNFTNGTGANAINLAWVDTRTYNSTGTTLDLSNLTAASTNGNRAATFTAIKTIQIVNNDATNTVIVGNASGTQFTPGWSSATATQTLQPGGVLLATNPSAAGWTTTSANNLKIASGAGTPSVTVTLLGLD